LFDPHATFVRGSNPVLAVDPWFKAPSWTAGHDITCCAIPSMNHRIWARADTRI